MQTFLPYADFTQSARCLDRQRLGKQRVETLQILNALTNPRYGWKSHPAVNMWRGHTQLLAVYGVEMCREWLRRGYDDNTGSRIAAFFDSSDSNPTKPYWLGLEAVHASHRSNLLRKDRTHYAQFNWTERDDLPYFWPLPQGNA